MDNADANYISNWNIGPSNVPYPLHNPKFFETLIYSNDTHTTLKVSHIGNRTNLQLGFDYLIVQDGTVPSRTTGTTVSKSGGIPSGAIAGCVIGGFLVLLVIAILFFYLCQRRLNQRGRLKFTRTNPFPSTRNPFTFPVDLIQYSGSHGSFLSIQMSMQMTPIHPTVVI